MKNGCTCNCSSNCNKDLIVITIQSGGNNKKSKSKNQNRQSTADAYSEAPDADSESVDTVESQKSSTTPGNLRDPSRSRHSVAEAKQVAKTYQRLYKLPIVCDRHHGPGCAMEICVLEKHEDSCMFKKEDNSGRNLKDDKVESYDCIGRMVFKTCNEGGQRTRPNIVVTAPSRASIRRDRSRGEFDPDKQIIGGVIAERTEPGRASVYSQPSKMSSMRQVHEYNEDGVDEEPVRAKSASRTYQTPPRKRPETAASPWKSNGDSVRPEVCNSSAYRNGPALGSVTSSGYANNSQGYGKAPSSGYENNSQGYGKAPSSGYGNKTQSYGKPQSSAYENITQAPANVTSSYYGNSNNNPGYGKATSPGYGNAPRHVPYYERQEVAYCNAPATAPPWRSYGDSGPACPSSSFENNRQGFCKMSRPPERRDPATSSLPLVFSFNKKTQSQADESNQTPLYFSYIKTSEDSLSSYENLTTKKKYGSGLIAGLFGSSRRKSQQRKSKYHK